MWGHYPFSSGHCVKIRQIADPIQRKHRAGQWMTGEDPPHRPGDDPGAGDVRRGEMHAAR